MTASWIDRSICVQVIRLFHNTKTTSLVIVAVSRWSWAESLPASNSLAVGVTRPVLVCAVRTLPLLPPRLLGTTTRLVLVWCWCLYSIEVERLLKPFFVLAPFGASPAMCQLISRAAATVYDHCLLHLLCACSVRLLPSAALHGTDQ